MERSEEDANGPVSFGNMLSPFGEDLDIVIDYFSH